MNPHSAAAVHGWMLDVDGVILDVTSKRLTQPVILDELITRMALGEPVVLNTGRGAEWVLERVVGPLRLRARQLGFDPNELLQRRFLIIGEKGTQVSYFDAKDNAVVVPDPRYALPTIVRTLAQETAARFAHVMTCDASKEVMVSIEMNKPASGVASAADMENFRIAQAQFVAEITQRLAQHGLEQAIRVDATAIAIDLQHHAMGKGLGARAALTVLKQWGHMPSSYTCVGDSPSDREMADTLLALGYDVNFVFVGAGAPTMGPAATLAMLQQDSRVRGLDARLATAGGEELAS